MYNDSNNAECYGAIKCSIYTLLFSDIQTKTSQVLHAKAGNNKYVNQGRTHI